VAGLALGPLLPPGVWRAIRRLRSAPLDGADNSNLRPGVLHRFTRSGRSPLLVARRSSDYRQAWLAAIGRYDPGNSRKGTLAGWGIDIRDPTADRRLVEYCLRVPLEVFHSKGRSRALARLALAGRVAPAALECMSRGYQAADWHEILVQAKADLVEEVERASRSPESAAILDMERLARLARDLPNQGWESVAAIRDYRGGLLRALAAADFIRRASGSNR
jgi:asparagine synthase (glutamine-hydrolysing)